MALGTAERRQLVKGSTLGAGVVLLAALLVNVNYFGWKYHHRFDWTGSSLYTLSEKSRNVLAGLDRDLEVVVFMRPTGELYEPVRELLARYEAASPRLAVRVVDPEKNLAEAQQLVDKYQVQNLNVVVFDAGDDRRVIEEADLAEYDYSGMQFGQGPSMTAFKGEQRFTGAIVELVEKRKPKILFTTGHGEADLDDTVSPRGLGQARELLGRDNFDIEEWASLGKAAVPAGTDLVVIAGPTSGFVRPELEALTAYLASGGRVLVLVDPALGGAGELADVGLTDWLAGYGVTLGADIVVDPTNPLPFFGAETIFLKDYGDHDITRALRQAEVPVIFPLARSVRQAPAVAAFTVTELLKTSVDGWGETDLANLRQVEKGSADVAGPVAVGVAVEEKGAAADEGGEGEIEDLDEAGPPAAGLQVAAPEESDLPGTTAVAPETTDVPAASTAAVPEPTAGEPQTTAAPGLAGEAAPKPTLRLVVYGDSDFAANGQLTNVGNGALLADTMNWLVERQQLLGIPPKQPEQVRLNLTRSQVLTAFWLTVAGLPLASILAGVWIYLQRRR